MHGFASYRSFGKARSLRSDRAWLELGRYVATGLCVFRDPTVILEFVRGKFRYVSVAVRQSVFGSIEIRTSFYREALCGDHYFTKRNFRKKMRTSIFWGNLDINFVITVFDPNS